MGTPTVLEWGSEEGALHRSSRQTVVSARAFGFPPVFHPGITDCCTVCFWDGIAWVGGFGFGIWVGSVRTAELGWERGLGITPALSLLGPFRAWESCGCCFRPFSSFSFLSLAGFYFAGYGSRGWHRIASGCDGAGLAFGRSSPSVVELAWSGRRLD